MSRKKGAEHKQICSLQQSHRDALVQYETAWRSQLDDYKQMYKSRVKLTVKTDDITIVGDEDAVIAVSNDVQEFLKSHAMQEQFLDMALDMAKMILQTKQEEINAIKDDVDDDVADPVIETSSRGIRILATEDTCEAVKVKLEEIKCEVLGVNEPLETTSRGITGDMRKQMISGHCNNEVKQKLKETKSNYEVMKDKEVPRAMGIYLSVFDPKQFSQLQTNVVSGCSNDASSNELTTDKMAAKMVSVYFKVNVGDTRAASSFAGEFGDGFINNLENQSKTVIENRTAPDNKPVASSGFLHDSMKMQIEDEDKDYTLYFCCGDLTDFPCDAIVNSTTPNLEFNGKLSRDIKGKGGSAVVTCCNTYVAANGTLSTSEVYAGCCPGELDCKTILHVSSPQWQHGGREKEKQLYDAVTNILTKAEEMRFYSVALPAISSGGFGFPLDVCLKNIFSAIRDYFEERIASGGKGLLREVHLVDINDKVFDTIKQCMNHCFDSRNIFDTNTRHSMDEGSMCFQVHGGNQEDVDRVLRTLKEKCSNLMVSTSPVPPTWSPMHALEHYKLELLTPKSMDYQELKQMFENSVPCTRVIKIERIQNRRLYERMLKHKAMILSETGYAANVEMKLWHGTCKEAADNIKVDGFTLKFVGKNGCAFGRGIYFAENPRTSTTYAKLEDGERCMFRCTVLVGNSGPRDNNSASEPPKGCHSVSGTLGSKPIYVVFRDTQAYPDYLITFR